MGEIIALFYLILVTPLDSLVGGREPEIILNFQRFFSQKMTFWNMVKDTNFSLAYNEFRSSSVFFEVNSQ